jgi:phosphoribosylanthranilate isomerase
MTKVKICGITNLEDALMAVRYGADMLGFNFYPESPRYIAPGASREITKKLTETIKRPVRAVGVFVNESLDDVLRIAIDTDITVIQLHGNESPGYFENVHLGSGGLDVIKAFRAKNLSIEDIECYGIRELAEHFEMTGVLIDAYSAAVYGGSGEVADWKFAREVSEKFPSVYLAGGLNANNVADAIRAVRPFAVDVASGVESSPGKKDPKKVEAFIRNAKSV